MASEAKAVWFRCATKLFSIGVLKPKDGLFFAIFCATYAQIRNARRSMVTGATRKGRDDAEEYVVHYGPCLNEMLLEMGFHSELEFEQFALQAIQ